MAVAKIELACDRCQAQVSFPVSAVGTVQQCPECQGYIDIEWPGEVVPPDPDDEDRREFARQWKESGRQLEVGRRHQEEWDRQLKVGKQQQEETTRLQARAEEAIQQLVGLLNRCEQLADRFEKVLRKYEE